MSLVSCDKSISQPIHIEGDGVFDFEGNHYETVIIGDQEWMSENLKATLFCNGDSINPVSGIERVKTYNSKPSSIDTFGLHYNYLAVEDTSGLCPCGWHVATELDFAKLIDYLGGFEEAMQKMKASGTIENSNGLWVDYDNFETRGNNISGFDAIPSGIVFYDNSMLRDSLTRFWAISNDTSEYLYFEIGNTTYVGKQTFTNPTAKEVNYFSIRCIKNIQ